MSVTSSGLPEFLNARRVGSRSGRGSDTLTPRAVKPGCTAGYICFLLLTAVLFIRPAEIIPDLESTPIYQVVMICCIALSLPALARTLSSRSLIALPGCALVLLLLPALIASHLRHANFYGARMDGLEFLKVLIYYLLLVGLITTRQRLETFLKLIVGLILIAAALSVLTYHGIIQIESLMPVDQVTGFDDIGERLSIPRLEGCGIFQDPNDFSLVLASAMAITTQLFTFRQALLRWLVRLPILGFLGYAFSLTRSRGGFLALVAGTTVLLLLRFGWKRAVPAAIVAVGVLLVLFGGRQTNIDIDNDNDTAQGRIHLWRDSLVMFHQTPTFGLGSGQLAEQNGLVAHNSYVQAFSELGLVGGTLFIGALLVQFEMLIRQARAAGKPTPQQWTRWIGCILVVLTTYCVGLYSLTRIYTLTTYVLLGLAAVTTRLAAKEFPGTAAVWGGPLLRRIAIASAASLATLEIFVRVMAG